MELLGCPKTASSQGTLQDPFRLSVLDFQRQALDRLAEIMNLLVESENNEEQGNTDLQGQLDHILDNSEDYAPKLGFRFEHDLISIRSKLNFARNQFAHQQYERGATSISPHRAQISRYGGNPSPKKTRTFVNTKSIILVCIEFSERVKNYFTSQPTQLEQVYSKLNFGKLTTLHSGWADFGLINL